MTTAADFEPVIGLEIHAELSTQSKMFCGCQVLDPLGAEPNTAICPVCLGLPGALPVVNRRAVECAIQVSLALNCQVRDFLAFARKNYFYPDLPKGYQISQHEFPIGYGGYLDVPTPNSPPTRVRVRRAHLEEDTAKLLHVPGKDASLIDFNRAGVPLLEIVTEPDIRTAAAAMEYATAIRSILLYLGVNSGDMEKGVFRLEANVSVRRRGDTNLSTRTEIKNLNSFRSLGRGVELEVARQIEVVLSGGKVVQQTIGWDKDRDILVPQRTKENADDYRYFPEPDLPPVPVAAAWVDRLRTALPELPAGRCIRFREQYGLPAADAELLTGDRALADYFEAVAKVGGSPKTAANWILGEFLRLLNTSGTSPAEAKVQPEKFAELLRLVDQRAITAASGKVVLGDMFETGEAAPAIVARLGLGLVGDADELTRIATSIVDTNPGQVAQYFGGKETVFQWLVGQVMKATKGKADPQQARESLKAVLDQRKT